MKLIRYFLLGLALALGVVISDARAHNPSGGHDTTSTLTCAPNPLGVNLSSTCTATVTDINLSQTAVPVGTVNFSASGAGSFSSTSCTLAAAGGFSASCSVTYTPTATGTQTITAAYPQQSNGTHTWAATTSNTTLTVLARPTVAKSFGTNPIVTGASSLLTITLSNSNTVAITGVAFTDTYPAGLTNATTASTTCTGGTASATIGGATVSLAGGTIPASGSCAVTVSVTSSTAGSYANSIAIGAVTSTNAGSNTVAASATLTVNPSVASFDAVEVGASPHTNLYTKLSGVNFSVDILALDSSNLVSSGYTGTVSLVLVDASSGGGVCASMTSLQGLGSLTFVAGDLGRKTKSSINYAGAARNAKIRITDAALGITSCSFDAFAIRPTSLSIASNMTNTATSGAPFVNAGGNFTLTATALAGYDGTPAVDNTKLAAHAGAIQTGSTTGVFAAALPATGIASGSTFTYSEVGNFQFLAQGVFDASFTAVDQPNDCTNDFSNTLVGGKYGCKFGNTVATSFFGRFTPDHFVISLVSLTNRSVLGCSPASTFTHMDEAMALAFTLTAANTSGATTKNYTTASSFAKLDPTLPRYFNFVAKDTVLTSLRAFAISAITNANPGKVTTALAHGFVSGQQVYITGVNGMTQINGQLVTVTVIDATNFTIGIDTSGYSAYSSGGTVSRLAGLTSSGSWTAGVGNVSATVALKRAVTPDGPYTALNVGIAPKDDDGVALLTGVLNLDADSNGINDSYNVGTTETRFGRLRVANVFGSTLLDLPLALTTQHYNGNFFVTNTLDSCTILAATNIRMAFVSGTNLVACQTALSPTGSIYFNAGKASAVAPPALVSPPKLTKPPSGNSGAVDLTVNLNGSVVGNTCIAVGGLGPAVTNASKPYLQGNWGSGSYSDDPGARATFGIFKNADQFLYLREIY
jgi:MSHA biogenesis protein MshQ